MKSPTRVVALMLLSLCLVLGIAVAGDPVDDLLGDQGLGEKNISDRKLKENTDVAFDELGGRLTLFFYDAVSGAPISGGQATFEGVTAATEFDGRVSFDFPQVPDLEGYRPLVFQKPGYITSTIRVHVIAQSVYIHRYSISPSLPPGRYRVVLDWGKEPKDLDAHLVKHDRYHISYRDMKKFEDQAWLDRDDTDGEGPETITIQALDPEGHYTFMVHDYTNRDVASFGAFKQSKAHVMIFNDRQMVKSFEVPTGAGRVWKVFEIRNAQIVDDSRIIDMVNR